MSYLQRLLERAAAVPRAESLALRPALPSRSPVVEADQRLNDPDLVGPLLGRPLDIAGPDVGPEELGSTAPPTTTTAQPPVSPPPAGETRWLTAPPMSPAHATTGDGEPDLEPPRPLRHAPRPPGGREAPRETPPANAVTAPPVHTGASAPPGTEPAPPPAWRPGLVDRLDARAPRAAERAPGGPAMSAAPGTPPFARPAPLPEPPPLAAAAAAATEPPVPRVEVGSAEVEIVPAPASPPAAPPNGRPAPATAAAASRIGPLAPRRRAHLVFGLRRR